MAMVRCGGVIAMPVIHYATEKACAVLKEQPVGSNEPPEETPDRTITIRLNSENIILAAAILFLLAAVVLAVFFSLDTSVGEGPTSTTVVAGLATAVTSPVGTATATVSGQPGLSTTAVSTLPTFVTQPYPGPGEPGLTPTGGNSPNTVPTPTSDELFAVDTPSAQTPVAGTPIANQQVPTFAPSRPTATVTGGNNAYPVPATAPAQSTAQAATVAPTALAPTNPPFIDPTAQPATSAPLPAPPTSEPAGGAGEPPTAAPPRPTATPVPPTPVPIDTIRGAMRWSADQSPVIVRRDLQIAPGSSLVIDPGVEVRIAPGVAIYVDGKLYATGQPGKPVKITSTGGGRWDAIYGRPGGDIGFDRVELSGGGNGGTLIYSEGGNLTVLRSQVRNNGGQIRTYDSRLEMRETDVSGNDMPYGAAVESGYSTGGGVILNGNRIGGNRLAAGAPSVQVRNESTFDTLNLDAQGNLMVGSDGPAMVITTNGPMLGTLSCNSWMNGTNGLSIKSSLLQVAPELALNISNNLIADQTPPIIPIYLKYGIGRGASSDLYVDMRGNYWNSALGPYHPDLYADGRGEAVGANIDFIPWLTERPACAPRP